MLGFCVAAKYSRLCQRLLIMLTEIFLSKTSTGSSQFFPALAPSLLAMLLLSCASREASSPDRGLGPASVKSPDGTIELVLRANGPLTYAISVDGKPLLTNSRLGLRF